MKLNHIYTGHVLDVLRGFPSGKIDMVITSPPYYGLRAYDTEPQIWDSVEGCEHEWGSELIQRTSNNYNKDFNERYGNSPGQKKQEASSYGEIIQGNFCLHCNAWRGELGLEPHPNLYIAHLMQIFDEVKRVLKKEGSFWLNMGDSFWGSNSTSEEYKSGKKYNSNIKRPRQNNKLRSNWLQQKQLLLMPHRIAIAMQDRSWILRNDCVWYKPNAMPSSVKDRLNNCHEYVFHFVKSRKYYYDLDAIREEPVDRPDRRDKIIIKKGNMGENGLPPSMGSVLRNRTELCNNPLGKNPGDVWIINTRPFPEAHFAVFPEELVVKPIKASCPEGGIVMDIFSGSGTTLQVAHKLGRPWVGIELGKEYVDMAERAMSQEIKF